MRGRSAMLVGMALSLLLGCGNIYERAEAGRLQGQLLVLWVDEGSDSGGDGRFILVPPADEDLHLTFTRPAGAQHARVIRPGPIYTDGGSIPRVVQPFRGFNPWGYAPAYMIHDWLFVARRCLTDGEARPEERIVADLEFRDSAVILAEVIRTLEKQNLVRPRDVAPRAISLAVTSGISRGRWEAAGECQVGQDRLTPEHVKLVRELQGRPTPGARAVQAGLRGDVASGEVIQVLSFGDPG